MNNGLDTSENYFSNRIIIFLQGEKYSTLTLITSMSFLKYILLSYLIYS